MFNDNSGFGVGGRANRSVAVDQSEREHGHARGIDCQRYRDLDAKSNYWSIPGSCRVGL